MHSLSLDVSCTAGLPVVRAGQTVPSQAALCFDLESPAGDRTEGKKKGRPKAENQALRDIPVSSPRAGWALERCARKPTALPGLPAVGLALSHLPTSACCSVREGFETGPSGPHVGVLQA